MNTLDGKRHSIGLMSFAMSLDSTALNSVSSEDLRKQVISRLSWALACSAAGIQRCPGVHVHALLACISVSALQTSEADQNWEPQTQTLEPRLTTSSKLQVED